MSKQSHLPEWFLTLLDLGVIILLFAACSTIPLLLFWTFGFWFGFAGAVVAIVGWIYLVRPMPGFLDGIIALGGLAALFALLVAWIIGAIRYVAG